MNPDEKAKDKLCKLLMNCKILSTRWGEGEGESIVQCEWDCDSDENI